MDERIAGVGGYPDTILGRVRRDQNRPYVTGESSITRKHPAGTVDLILQNNILKP
jgi:hypothetical protein